MVIATHDSKAVELCVSLVLMDHETISSASCLEILDVKVLFPIHFLHFYD